MHNSMLLVEPPTVYAEVVTVGVDPEPVSLGPKYSPPDAVKLKVQLIVEPPIAVAVPDTFPGDQAGEKELE